MTTARALVNFLPFEVKLFIDTSFGRKLQQEPSPPSWLSRISPKSKDRALSVEIDSLTSVLEEYFDEFLRNEFNNANLQTIYAPFSHVSIQSIDRRKLRLEDQQREHDGSWTINTVRTGNLRKRFAQTYATYNRFSGVGVFTRDGDLPFPSANFLQAKQLQAQADVDGDLLRKMRQSDPSTGLAAVTAVELGVSSIPEQPTDNDGADQSGAAAMPYNAVIIIAVTVAACSMLLLGFAIYLAFRRRKDPEQNGQTKEVSPITKATEQNRSPNSKERPKQPLFEIKQSALQHDDAISDYTESVYSIPTAVKSAKKAWMKHRAEESVVSKSTKVSNRFNPRYIISSKLSNASSSADEGDLLFDNNDVSGEMDGVPEMNSPMKKALMATSQDPPVSTAMDTTGVSSSGLSESGLYPAEVIDDDIHSSLSAYGNGLSNHLKKMVEKGDDNASLKSYESYGFSLDGADYSTVANSTKYGY
jgi:hypothetical protein